MVQDLNRFARIDFVITRAVHEANMLNGVYTRRLPNPAIYTTLQLREEETHTFEDLMKLNKFVGEGYGWDRRKQYFESPSKENIKSIIEDKNSRRFSFWAGDVEVGGVVVANVEPLKDLKDIYKSAASRLPEYKDLKAKTAENTVEIYKIGLHKDYTGHRLGQYFFTELLKEIFDKSAGIAGSTQRADAVYLNTRDTNHSGVPRFYERMNMNRIYSLTHPDDLLSPEEIEAITRKSGNTAEDFPITSQESMKSAASRPRAGLTPLLT